MAAKTTEKPQPSWLQAKCPLCGERVVSNLYYVDGRGYVLAWECEQSLKPGEPALCDYRRVL